MSVATPIDELRIEVQNVREQDGGNARVHPNGFIQLDLEPVEGSWQESHKQGHSGAMRRLHIWNPPGIELPHQGTVNEIHDHVFDMRSTVVRGQLWQCLYEFETVNPDKEDPTHELYQAVYNKTSDSRLEATGEVGKLVLKHRFPVRAGETYTQPAFTLHDTESLSCVVTVMEKLLVHPGEAHVVCTIDISPDNDFDRASAAPVELLWEAIEASLR